MAERKEFALGRRLGKGEIRKFCFLIFVVKREKTNKKLVRGDLFFSKSSSLQEVSR